LPAGGGAFGGIQQGGGALVVQVEGSSGMMKVLLQTLVSSGTILSEVPMHEESVTQNVEKKLFYNSCGAQF
jgi:hypothetical protein